MSEGKSESVSHSSGRSVGSSIVNGNISESESYSVHTAGTSRSVSVSLSNESGQSYVSGADFADVLKNIEKLRILAERAMKETNQRSPINPQDF